MTRIAVESRLAHAGSSRVSWAGGASAFFGERAIARLATLRLSKDLEQLSDAIGSGGALDHDKFGSNRFLFDLTAGDLPSPLHGFLPPLRAKTARR